MHTVEDLIVDMMPFSDALKKYCKDYPEFLKALKIVAYDRFIALEELKVSGTFTPTVDHGF